MGVEVDWHDFKKICPASSTLATLIGCECHSIEQLGMEHEAKLVELDMPNSFISDPVFPKSLWDEYQDLHPKTLACIFVIAGKGRYLDVQLAERIEQIYDMCDDLTPVHLKIEACHKANADPGKLTMDKFKTIIIPRQYVLKTLDPDHTKPLDAIRTILVSMKDDCMALLDNEHDAGLNIEQVLDIHETFHHMTRDNSWGKVPWPCSCPSSNRDCVCKHGTLFTSIFDSNVHVPKGYIAAEPSLRKKTQELRGAAGPKRARLLTERRKETEQESKFLFNYVHGYGRERK
jgi:hypothetical protein